MGKKILKKVAEEAFLAVVMIVVFVAIAWGGFALIDTFTNPSEKAATSKVFTVTTPEETTAPAAPTAEAPPSSEAPALVVEPAPVVTEPAPAPKTNPAPQLNPDGSLPEGWLPPSNPGGPPTAPMSSPPPAPCMPGEGGERCAPVGG